MAVAKYTSSSAGVVSGSYKAPSAGVLDPTWSRSTGGVGTTRTQVTGPACEEKVRRHFRLSTSHTLAVPSSELHTHN